MAKNSIPMALRAASILVFVESFALVLGSGYFGFGIISGQARALPTLIALTAFTLAAAAWVGYIARSLMAAKKFARTPAVIVQLFQLSVAYGSFTGQFANPTVGFVLSVPSVIVIVLLFTKPVSALLQREV